MAAIAQLPTGTTFSYSTNGGSSYNLLPQPKSISGPKSTLPEVDVVNLESVEMEYIPGLRDRGTLSVTFLYTKTLMTTLQSIGGITYLYRISIPAGAAGAAATYTGSAFLAPIDPMFDPKEAMTITCDFRTTGPWTFA